MTVPLSLDLTARVAKLLPRLGSDQNGEVAATAAAIQRTLKAAGCDLHDLAAHVAEGPKTVVVYRERPVATEPPAYPFGSWREAARPRGNAAHRYRVFQCQNASAGRLNEWEAGFLLSLSQQLAKGRPLSAKQAGILDSIAERLGVPAA